MCKMTRVILSIFHGPHVESSFNTMGDVIGIKSCQTSVETYSSVQTVKYWFNSHQTTALKYFERKNVVNDPVDPKLCRNLKGASSQYRDKLKQRRLIREEKQKRLKLKKDLISKQQARALREEKDSSSRRKFQVKQK